MQKVYLCAFVPADAGPVGTHGPWNEEFQWQFDAGASGPPPVNRTGRQGARRRVREGVKDPGAAADSFHTDGTLYVFSTLRPPADGSLVARTIDHRGLSGLIFVVVLLGGLVLLPARLGPARAGSPACCSWPWCWPAFLADLLDAGSQRLAGGRRLRSCWCSGASFACSGCAGRPRHVGRAARPVGRIAGRRKRRRRRRPGKRSGGSPNEAPSPQTPSPARAKEDRAMSRSCCASPAGPCLAVATRLTPLTVGGPDNLLIGVPWVKSIKQSLCRRPCFASVSGPTGSCAGHWREISTGYSVLSTQYPALGPRSSVLGLGHSVPQYSVLRLRSRSGSAPRRSARADNDPAEKRPANSSCRSPISTCCWRTSRGGCCCRATSTMHLVEKAKKTPEKQVPQPAVLVSADYDATTDAQRARHRRHAGHRRSGRGPACAAAGPERRRPAVGKARRAATRRSAAAPTAGSACWSKASAGIAWCSRWSPRWKRRPPSRCSISACPKRRSAGCGLSCRATSRSAAARTWSPRTWTPRPA